MSARPVAVLMGGWSAERPISLLSGACAREALAARGVAAEAVDLRAPEDLAAPGLGRYACAFLALHGEGGEDGAVQRRWSGAGCRTPAAAPRRRRAASTSWRPSAAGGRRRCRRRRPRPWRRAPTRRRRRRSSACR